MTTKTQTDFRGVRTVTTLVMFAQKFSAWPCTWFRGRLWSPLFVGGSEKPAYRVSKGLSDLGTIRTTWLDGTPFRNQLDRDRSALAEAIQTAPDDPTAIAATVFLAERARKRFTDTPAETPG